MSERKIKVKLLKCECKNCVIRYICGLLTGNYCPWYNCEVPEPSAW